MECRQVSAAVLERVIEYMNYKHDKSLKQIEKPIKSNNMKVKKKKKLVMCKLVVVCVYESLRGVFVVRVCMRVGLTAVKKNNEMLKV